jgi:flagellum-specific peptidoglycan hydrolase FlgJ
VHTLPLPEVTDTPTAKLETRNSTQPAKIETRNSKLAPQTAKLENRNLKFENTPETAKFENGNSKFAAAQPEVPKFENGDSKFDGAQRAPKGLADDGAQPAPRVPSFDFRVSSSDFRLSPGSSHLTPQQLQFLSSVTPPALASEREYGIPACVTVAQAILESATAAGWGSSVLFRLANNPFGIKYCHFGTRDTGYGTRDTGYETRDTGYGTRNAGLGIRDSGLGKKQDTGLGTEGPVQEAPGTGSGTANSGFMIPDSGSKLGTRQAGLGTPDPASYGAFDAATWEIENGQKKTVMAQFQRFPNLTESFRCHALLLATSPRYAPAMQALKCPADGETAECPADGQ